MEHPGDAFLAELESHLMTLIVTSRQIVVHSCVACLGAVINKLTKNYPLVRDCFQKYVKISSFYKKNIDTIVCVQNLYTRIVANKAPLQRYIAVVAPRGKIFRTVLP